MQEPLAAQRRWPLAELRALLAAASFLTRLPIGRWVTLDADDVARAGVAFPLLGAGVGASVGALAAVLAQRMSALLAVALALAAGTLLTGALHLDALADTADALGARTRDRALEIMRDSTIGAFGAVAIALDLLLKAGALAALVQHAHVVRLALAAGAVSRMTPVLLAAALPYARAGGGTGAALATSRRVRAVLAALVALALAAGFAGIDGAVLWGCGILVAALAYVWLRGWLGGVTGDGLGAVLEVTETAALVVAVALVGAR